MEQKKYYIENLKSRKNLLDDLLGGVDFKFSPLLDDELLLLADEKWQLQIEQGLTAEQAWVEVIRDFNKNSYWSMDLKSKEVFKNPPPQKVTPERKLFVFLRTFFVPTFVTKVAIFYFGIHYAMYPGEGYGYGLVASMFLTVFNLTYFAYRRRRR